MKLASLIFIVIITVAIFIGKCQTKVDNSLEKNISSSNDTSIVKLKDIKSYNIKSKIEQKKIDEIKIKARKDFEEEFKEEIEKQKYKKSDNIEQEKKDSYE